VESKVLFLTYFLAIVCYLLVFTFSLFYLLINFSTFLKSAENAFTILEWTGLPKKAVSSANEDVLLAIDKENQVSDEDQAKVCKLKSQ